MKIKCVEIYHLQMPLKFSFKSAKTLLTKRDTIIIKVYDNHGNSGYGEVVAFRDPFYTDETCSSALQVLQDKYIPAILEQSISHPFDIHDLCAHTSSMALAGFENSLLDLYAKMQGKNLIQMLFGQALQDEIDVGLVFGDMPIHELEVKVDAAIKQGCKRIKFKIYPQINMGADNCYEKIKYIRKKFPNIHMLADANASFNINNIEAIKQYDDLDLLCIEEPFALLMPQISSYSSKDFANLRQARKNIKTKFCYDESLLTLSDMQKAYDEGVLQMINIKIGRLGGLYYVMQVLEFCKANNIPFWIGSMLETGISKILHVQLAALGQSCMAGDLSDSKRYFDEDVIKPDINSQHGKIKVPCGLGIGVEVQEQVMKKYCKSKLVFGKQ